jgi:phospholipase C
MKHLIAVAAVLGVLTSGCASPTSSATPWSSERSSGEHLASSSASPIQHIIFIVQENRTPDNLFQHLPNADISKTGVDYNGKTVKLHAVSLAAPWDLSHGRQAFIDDYNHGKMDGFNKKLPEEFNKRPFGYVPRSQAQPYLDMATEYAFADRMFETQQAGSFPAHQYLVSGTSSALPKTDESAANNPYREGDPGTPAPAGCDAPSYSVVETLSRETGKSGPDVFPCFDRPVLSDLLDEHDLSWRYYQHNDGAGLWHALDAISHVRYGPDYANVVSPAQTILKDISSGHLPALSWVMPPSEVFSDHPGSRSAMGPAWVAAVVNAVGRSSYWDSTAIFITWDDWGGWYDHVAPTIYNHFELGFRVPLVVVSPYAKKGYVSHKQHEFGSLLRFAETTFDLGSLHSTDHRSDNLMDVFDFKQPPSRFKRIQAPPFHPGDDTLGGPDTSDPE